MRDNHQKDKSICSFLCRGSWGLGYSEGLGEVAGERWERRREKELKGRNPGIWTWKV